MDPRSIIIFGRSLGGAIAADLALRRPAAALIMESTFSSLKDLGAEIYPFLPVRLLSRYDYNTLEKVQSIKCPKLIIHSRDDETIPFRHGQRLFEASSDPKEFLEIKGPHNGGFLTVRGQYKRDIESLIRRCLVDIEIVQ